MKDPHKYDFEGLLADFKGNVYGLHIIVPDEISKSMRASGTKRWKALIDHKEQISFGLMSSKSGWYILINQQLAKKLEGIPEVSKHYLEITPDDSEFGMEMPEELQATFDQEPEAFEHFKNLTPGKQRNLIYLVNKVKNIDSRIKKSLAIVAHLKETKGNLDFKQLNQTIKFYNQNF